MSKVHFGASQVVPKPKTALQQQPANQAVQPHVGIQASFTTLFQGLWAFACRCRMHAPPDQTPQEKSQAQQATLGRPPRRAVVICIVC